MALIERFVPSHGQSRARRHSGVECGYSVFGTGAGRIVQLDTYGSAERAIPGKTSQSIQLDEAAARALVTILRDAFPELFR